VLPTGDVNVADRDGGRLLRVEPSGQVKTIMSSLSFPDGIEIDRAGMVYLTDLALQKVYRVEPFTGEYTVLVQSGIDYPDGITFDPTYEHLYIGGVAGVPTIYRLAVDADGNPGDLEPYVTGVGSGEYDGIATDACGNLYITDLAESKVFRVAPDKTVTVALDRTATQSYMTSLQWGTGVGGWETLKAYVPDVGYGTLEVDLGVPSKPR
jgi:sugar lactone lactonase YvrE